MTSYQEHKSPRLVTLPPSCQGHAPFQHINPTTTTAISVSSDTPHRPVVTTFSLSVWGWQNFRKHFKSPATAATVLTRKHMAPYRSSAHAHSGHAVALVSCDAGFLTFINSWGPEWGNNGLFSVEDVAVLQRDTKSGRPSPVNFYDVYWLEKDLTDEEQRAYRAHQKKMEQRKRELPRRGKESNGRPSDYWKRAWKRDGLGGKHYKG